MDLLKQGAGEFLLLPSLLFVNLICLLISCKFSTTSGPPKPTEDFYGKYGTLSPSRQLCYCLHAGFIVTTGYENQPLTMCT